MPAPAVHRCCCLGILIVALAKPDKKENSKVYAALREAYGDHEWLIKDGKLVVGCACLKLNKDSKRKGEFRPPGEAPDIPDERDVPSRDQSKEAVDNVAHVIGSASDRHYKDEFVVDMLAVHPQYWRNGHGTSLLLWATKLADKDKVCLGIASVPMAVQISCNVGFKMMEEVEVEGYSEHPEGFKAWIGRREPGAATSLPVSDERRAWSVTWLFSGFSRIFSK